MQPYPLSLSQFLELLKITFGDVASLSVSVFTFIVVIIIFRTALRNVKMLLEGSSDGYTLAESYPDESEYTYEEDEVEDIEPEDILFCSYCGTPHDLTDKKCDSCGAPLRRRK